MLRGYSVRSINTLANEQNWVLCLMLNYSAKLPELQKHGVVSSRSSLDDFSYTHADSESALEHHSGQTQVYSRAQRGLLES